MVRPLLNYRLMSTMARAHPRGPGGYCALLVVLTLALGGARATSASAVRAHWLHNLSDFSGPLPYPTVRLHVDQAHDETYVIDQGTIRIFNRSGMAVHEFAFDALAASVRDLAVDEAGNILLLTWDFSRPGQPVWSIERCDYRGDRIAALAVTELPAPWSELRPERLLYRDRRVTLLGRSQMLAVRLDPGGSFEQGYDLRQLAEASVKEHPNAEIFGFDLSPSGEMLFTIPEMFRAFIVAPDGSVRDFGKAGSGAGKFGIVSGITADDHGHYLVSDRLRRVVMVFDHDLAFRGEFGGRSLAVPFRPVRAAAGPDGQVYVTQSGRHGVAVFSLVVE
jgi:hypothetical protein